MPALPDRLAAALQLFAGRRQTVAVMRVEVRNETVSADYRSPLAVADLELAHALHSLLQELEFQELKQWKYLR